MTTLRRILPLLFLFAALGVVFPHPVQASSARPGAAIPVPALPVAPNTSATAATTTAPQTVVINSGPSMDQLKQETPALFQSVLGGFLGALDQGLTDVLTTAQGFNFLTQTPPGLSYAHPDIRRLWDAVRAVTNAALALIALVGGYNVILHRRLGTEYAGTMEFLPRLAVGALLANTSMWWASAAIDANNAVSIAFKRVRRSACPRPAPDDGRADTRTPASGWFRRYTGSCRGSSASFTRSKSAEGTSASGSTPAMIPFRPERDAPHPLFWTAQRHSGHCLFAVWWD
jgi:hypothetical protein